MRIFSPSQILGTTCSNPFVRNKIDTEKREGTHGEGRPKWKRCEYCAVDRSSEARETNAQNIWKRQCRYNKSRRVAHKMAHEQTKGEHSQSIYSSNQAKTQARKKTAALSPQRVQRQHHPATEIGHRLKRKNDYHGTLQSLQQLRVGAASKAGRRERCNYIGVRLTSNSS